MKRALVSVGLCALALGVGLATSRLAARNRARADDLDRRHHRCEIFERQNRLLALDNERLEWGILRGEGSGPDGPAHPVPPSSAASARDQAP